MTDQKLEVARLYAGLGRQDVYAVKQTKGYDPVREKLTSLVLERHVDDVRPIGVYPVTGSTTRLGVIDFDDHDGATGWERMRVVAMEVMRAAEHLGLKPHSYRSGGGQGIHLWFIWHNPQPAADVRYGLQALLASAGLSDGSGGVAKGQAEVFPRQSQVEKGKLGNLIALPGARMSAPLSMDTLAPIEWSDIDWCDLATRESATFPAAPESEANPVRFEPLPGDQDEVRDALRRVSSDDYWIWLRIGLGLKEAFGDAGLALFNEWSAKSPKYQGLAKTEAFFGALRPDGRITLGTIFHLAGENGWNGPSNPMIREMNARYGIYTHGRTTEIILKEAVGGPEDIFLGKQPFLDRHAGDVVERRDPEGNVERIPKARAWMNHPKASHYERVIFDPALPPGHNGDAWNLWKGFAVEPEPGDWSLLKDHILSNISQGVVKVNDWLLNWMALGVQQPGLVVGTAPVLIGFPGTGKGVLAHAYGKLWGPHFVPVTHEEHVTGRFSGHLFARRFVFVDEGIFGGKRKDAGVIKTRITDSMIVLERKGVDAITVENKMIFMVASNEASVVPADKGDRRWMVIEVGSARREDHTYFGAIQRQMDEGGYAAMLHDLLSRDISQGPDPRRTIKTEALFEQMLLAQPAEVRYLHGILDLGRLPQNWIAGPSTTTIRALIEELHHLYRDALRIDDARLGRFINKAIPQVRAAPGGLHFIKKVESGFLKQRSTRYDFPPLAVARTAFEKYVNMPIPWQDVDDWQRDPDPDEEEGGGSDYDDVL